MKLRNLKMNESISKQFEHALEDEYTILEPTEANALEVEAKREEQIKDDFKEQDKVADEVAKATNASEVNEPKKVKDRKELSKLLAEAKEAGKQFKISRCNEEGYRYLFETIETEENKELLTEKKGTKYIFFGVDKDGNEVTKKEFVDDSGVVKTIKVERNKLFDDDKVDTIYVSEVSETGEEKPIDRYMISREEFIKGESLEEEVSARPNHDKILDMLHQGVLEYKTVAEDCLAAMSDDLIGDVLKDFDLEECKKSLKEENGDPSLDEKLPETFEGKMDFLAADEEEAIEGYDKVLLALEEGDPVREQLEKIRDEEVAHKEFLEKVKSDKTAIYKAPSEAEEVKDAVDLDEKCKENLEESKLEEADEPAAESIENCQKWVDYDMEHYGDVSKNTQEIIEKAGYQLIKDDHGDYEVAARDYEESLTEETNMEKINKALASLDMKEDLGEDDHFDFTSELYDEMRAVLKKYADKGVTKDDLSAALSFIDVHMDDDDELEFLDKNEIEAKSKPVEVVDEEKTEEVVEEKLEEAEGKKSAGAVLNACQDVWGVATSPDEMRKLVLKCLEDHKDEIADKEYAYAKMSFEKANRNAIFGLVAAFTTGMAMSPNKQHKQNVKDLESESLNEEVIEEKKDLGFKVGDEITIEGKTYFVVELDPETNSVRIDTDPEGPGISAYDANDLRKAMEEKLVVEEDEKPFEEEKVEYEVDDDFDWKY